MYYLHLNMTGRINSVPAGLNQPPGFSRLSGTAGSPPRWPEGFPRRRGRALRMPMMLQMGI